jgi:hypothetical protein
MRQVDRDVLPLRVALEHAFEGELAADAVLRWSNATLGPSAQADVRFPRAPSSEPWKCPRNP